VLFTLLVIIIMFTVKRIPLGMGKLYARTILIFLLVTGLNIEQLFAKYFWVFLTFVIASERLDWTSSNISDVTEYINSESGEETTDINC